MGRRVSFAAGLVLTGLMTTSVSAWPQDPFSVLLVDKLKNQIHVARYLADHIEIVKSFHATLGKARGDKEIENDLKTPEGIYLLTGKRKPPQLAKKFGAMGLTVNYPNPIDKLAGKTGYGIMLHATDDPPRLKKDLDSDGCVVVDNSQIEEIAPQVRLGLTPIIIYPELKPEYLKADGKPEVREAFERWMNAWQGKDIDNYIGSYAPKFHYNGMNLKQYREYKNSLNQKYAEIRVTADNLRYFYHPKYDVVQFTQRYESTLKHGGKGFKSSGTKWLYFVKDEGGKRRIVDESYSSLVE